MDIQKRNMSFVQNEIIAGRSKRNHYDKQHIQQHVTFVDKSIKTFIRINLNKSQRVKYKL